MCDGSEKGGRSSPSSSSCTNTLSLNHAKLWWTAGDGWGLLRIQGRLVHALRSLDVGTIADRSAKLAATLDSLANSGRRSRDTLPQVRLTNTAPRAIGRGSLPPPTHPCGSYICRPGGSGTWNIPCRGQKHAAVCVVEADEPALHLWEVERPATSFAWPTSWTASASRPGVSTLAPVLLSTAAALDEARAAGGGVLLPVGKLFVDGPLQIPPRTTLRGSVQELSTIYFLEDGLGRQLGGVARRDGSSPAPDPAYLHCNCTDPWGIEDLSFSNTVLWLPPGGASGCFCQKFWMRRVLLREDPCFCLGYGLRQHRPCRRQQGRERSCAAGGEPRRGNCLRAQGPCQLAGELECGRGPQHQRGQHVRGYSNAEIADCDLTCTKWGIRVLGNQTYFPLGGDPALVLVTNPND